MLKVTLGFLILFTASLASAEGKNFAEKKSRFLQKLDKKIGFIQQAKECANSATDKAGLKQCRQTLRASMKSLKKHKKGQ